VNRANHQSGVVLIMVLWTIVFLSALAMAASTTFRGFAGVIGLSQDKIKADALLDAGLEAAASIVGRLGDEQPLTDREAELSLSTGSVHLRLSDEAGRIDINKAPVKVLSALLQYAGADGPDAAAKSIDAWRLQKQGNRSQAPDALSTKAAPTEQTPPSNSAEKQADQSPAFTDVRQLAGVPGVSSAVMATIAPMITVFGGDKVNALTAPPEVLAALPGMRRSQISALLDARQRPLRDGQLQSILGPAGDYVESPQRRTAAAVEITARLIDGYSEAARATIMILPHDNLAYRVLAWTPASTDSFARTPTDEE